MSTLLGIDIGGTAVKIGVVDENGKVLLSETRSVSFDGYKTSIMTTVANLAGEVLEKSPVKIEGIGVSATGQIDVNSGTVIGVGAQLGDWLGSPVKKILEDRFHLPVTVINDANAAALGEQTFGRAKGKENVLVVTVGTGIGGGIIENGRLIQGRRGIGGEIGHYIINFDGVECPCGNRGCGGHSIGVPLAVAAKHSFIAPSASMTIHPVRMSGLMLGVPQTLEYFQRMQDRITNFVTANSGISYERFMQLAMNTQELVMDVGTVLDGDEAVAEGLIDTLGSLHDAMDCLDKMIAAEKNKQRAKPRKGKKSL